MTTTPLKLALLLAALGGNPLRGEIAEAARTFSAAGGFSAAGSYLHLGCLGQPGMTWTTAGSGRLHHAGFLAVAPLRPTQDSDADGLPDELEEDNDGDGLADAEEIRGTPWHPAPVTSNPNHPDSDADGFSDAAEAAAGTDPTDAGDFLSLLLRPLPAGGMRVEWPARNGRHYRVHRLAAPDAFPGVVRHAVTHSNTAPGPFFAGWEGFDDLAPLPAPSAFYAIEVVPEN